MLRRSQASLETWRARYHRIGAPRRLALQRHREHLELQKAREAAKGARPGSAAAATINVPEKTYRYNRWWADENSNFVHQAHVIEDPEVIMRRRTSLPEPTADDKWKKPMKPFFEPLKPYVDVKDFPKDPDVKQLKPATIPRWKDFMMRQQPMVPRTWY